MLSKNAQRIRHNGDDAERVTLYTIHDERSKGGRGGACRAS